MCNMYHAMPAGIHYMGGISVHDVGQIDCPDPDGPSWALNISNERSKTTTTAMTPKACQWTQNAPELLAVMTYLFIEMHAA